MAKKKKSNDKKDKTEREELIQVEEREVLPQNVLKIGEQVLQDKNIYILQSVYKEIHEFTKDKLTVESGGMLMGYTLQANGKTNIIIEGFIEGKYSEGTVTTLKFTHETWDYVHQKAETQYPEDKIIGWIHTHPNFGIFLSNYDKFIHENFFNDENQIAYVVDPIQHIEGFFFWINGQIEKCPGFYIYDSVGAKINIDDVAEETKVIEEKTIRYTPVNDKIKTLLFACLAGIIICAVGLLITCKSILELRASINSLNEQVISQNEQLNMGVQTANDNILKVGSDINKHTVVFLSDDGTVISKKLYETGEKIVLPEEVPVKDPDEKYTYTFVGWKNIMEYACNDAVYVASFEKKPREYKIVFENEKGEVLSEQTYSYGETPDVPEYYPDSIEETFEVTWDKEISPVKEDTKYRAVLRKPDNQAAPEEDNGAASTPETDLDTNEAQTEPATVSETTDG